MGKHARWLLPGLALAGLLLMLGFIGFGRSGFGVPISASKIKSSDRAFQLAHRPQKHAYRHGIAQRGMVDRTKQTIVELTDGGIFDLQTAREQWLVESPDAAWTEEEYSYISAMLDDFDILTERQDVACRATVCRIVLEFADPGEAERLAGVAGDRNVHRWIDVTADAAGLHVEVFLSRSLAVAR